AEPAAGVPVIVAVRGDGPAACAVNVSDAGFPDCVIVRLSAASASVALAVTVQIAAASQPRAVAVSVIRGSRFTFAIVSTVFVLSVAFVAPVPSFSPYTTLFRPAAPAAGVPVIVAVRGEGPAACAVNVNDAGFPACVIVRLFAASASVAFAVIVPIAVPSDPHAVAGAAIDGLAFAPAAAPTPSVAYPSAVIAPAPPHGAARTPKP